MKRMKPYDVPHKGLRNALSQLSLLAGRTNYSSPQEIEKLYQLGEDVFKILNIHASDENEVTLAALEARCPGASGHDMKDHERIHEVQSKLEKLLEKIYNSSKTGEDLAEEGDGFYLAFTEFQSSYLEHIAEEERETQPLLWEHFTDEELAAHRGKIMAKNPPETLLIWFKFVVPAQNHIERSVLLTGFKKMASAEFYHQGMDVIKQVLTKGEFSALQTALND